MLLLQIIEGLSPARWSWLARASVAEVARWLETQRAPAQLAPRLIALARQRPALMQLIEPAREPALLLDQLRRAGRSPAALLGALDEREALALLGAVCGVSAQDERAGRFDGWPVWRLDEAEGLCIKLPTRWALAASHDASLSLRCDGPRVARYVPDGLRHRWRLIDALQLLPVGRLEVAAPLLDVASGARIDALELVGEPVALFVGGRRVWRVEPGEEAVCVFDHGAQVSRMSGGFARDDVWSARHGRELWRGVVSSEHLMAWDEGGALLCALAPGRPVWPQRGVLTPPPLPWPFELALIHPRQPGRAAALDAGLPLTLATLTGATALEVRGAPWALVRLVLADWRAELMLDSRGRARLWMRGDEEMTRAAHQAEQLVVCCGEERLVFTLSHDGVRPRGRLPGLRLMPTDEPRCWRVEGVQAEAERFWLHLTPCARPWTSHRVEVDAASMIVTLPQLPTRGRHDVRAEGASAGPGWVELDGVGDVAGPLGSWFAQPAHRSADTLREALMALEAGERRRVVEGLVSWYRHHHTQHHTMAGAVLRALAPWRLLAGLRAHTDTERALWTMSGPSAAWYAVKPQDLWCALELAGPLDGALWRGWLDALDARRGGLRAMALEVWRAPLTALAATGWVMPEQARGPSAELARPLAELDGRELPWERLAGVPASAPLSAAEAALVVDPRERIVADWAYALHRERLGLWSAPLPADAHRSARNAPALMDHWLNIWTRRERMALQELLAAETSWPHAQRGPMRG
jgi:hypothetical protein